MKIFLNVIGYLVVLVIFEIWANTCVFAQISKTATEPIPLETIFEQITPPEFLKTQPPPVTPVPEYIPDTFTQALTRDGFVFLEPPIKGLYRSSVGSTQLTFSYKNKKIQEEKIIPIRVTTAGFGYQLHVTQLQPFQTAFSTTLPNTTCQSNSACDHLRALPWKKEKIYGIGYTLIGSGVHQNFTNGTFYRSFSLKEFVPVLTTPFLPTSNNIGMKVRISTPLQEQEYTYQGVISILVLPNL